MTKFLSMLAFLLIIVGALNWGLWGFFQFDAVAWLCGGNATPLSRLIYAVVGLAGVWSLRLIPRCCHFCSHACTCRKDKTDGGCCR